MRAQRMIHRVSTPVSCDGKKWKYETEDRDVVVLAIVGKYAMVRRPRCLPYVADVKDLHEVTP